MVRTRKRLSLACDACRARRIKCDGQKPSCAPCRIRGVDCSYQAPPESPPSKVEAELVSVNLRLDYITMLLAKQSNPHQELAQQGTSCALGSHEDSPFRLLATSSIMEILGLEEDYARGLIRLERTNLLVGPPTGPPGLFFGSHQQVTNALAAFSERVHAYFSVLPLDFSEAYFHALSGPLTPSCQSCLVLLVAAIGCVAHDAATQNPYFDAALASLPLVLAECSLASIQCLIFLSIYYCCRLRPCQAHDYCLIASFKIQNLFKSGSQSSDQDALELTYRAYWAILLLERQVPSELSVQLDVAKSDIWRLDEYIPLPNCRHTWHFPLAQSPTSPATVSPASIHSTDSTTADQAQSFFLAEIAMRRMLHRCNSAVTQGVDGQSRYAPSIALELERQLDEWYGYLPGNIRFTKDEDRPHAPTQAEQICSLSNFLSVQYYCCRLSIYWPAVYQAMQDESASAQLLSHCQRFIDSYVFLLPRLRLAIHDCLIYRWTLSLTFFITTMAVLKVVDTPCLGAANLDGLRQCLSSIGGVSWDGVDGSPSLTVLQYTLNQRLERFSPPAAT
ncbi:uncharacterized protein BJX67DRAFT_385916 [Aspergillus lucknowensis]|uniref:Zn(2)-C6 fungal-type domain-containing protein n=1 Tax=Aspergillus lucknowensis TaxID=176173 RepID=A0ABR4L9G7_9EURO